MQNLNAVKLKLKTTYNSLDMLYAHAGKARLRAGDKRKVVERENTISEECEHKNEEEPRVYIIPQYRWSNLPEGDSATHVD
mgnify:CR=1 FL=1